MDKFKVFNLDSSLSLKEIKSLLSERSHSENISFQFTPLKFTDSCISYRFSEKKILETSFLDKNGNEQVLEYLHIDSFEFKISQHHNQFYVILVNPSRSLKIFKHYLAENLNYQIGLGEILLNPLDWIKRIEEQCESNFSIISMEVKDIIFDNNTSGIISLKSSNDIRNSYTDIIKNKNFKIGKILATNHDFFQGKIILCKDASFQVESINSTKLIDFILDTII